MCGIIGVVASAPVETSPLPVPLAPSPALAAQPLDVLDATLQRLQQELQHCFQFAQVSAALTEPRQADALRELGASLDGLVSELEARLMATASVEVGERLSAAIIRARDVAWRVQQDLVPNLSRISSLSPRSSLSLWPRYELWKVNSLLNGIDRLEVRGRDSAGMVLEVHFPSTESLTGLKEDAELGPLLAARQNRQDFVDGSIRQVQGANGPVLLFAYKVANEIGEMGENVAGLRARVAADAVLHAAIELPGVRVAPLAHTRWASNGVISEPNCHPLDNGCILLSPQASLPQHNISAVLNGDIDNYQALKERLIQERGLGIAPSITTDGKIIPLWIDRNLQEGMSFEEAFRRAVSEFQGSMAIAVQTTLEPGKVYLAQRGSGQSIYIGFTGDGFLFASELYGLVEETGRFIKLDGEKERIPGEAGSNGQLAVLDGGWNTGKAPTLSLSWYDGSPIGDVQRLIKTAEITTRDINRAGFEHFMLKEITESVQSVKKTIRGRYRVESEKVTFAFERELFPAHLREKLTSGGIRRIYCIGQGTAAVAGSGIAALMAQHLADAPVEIIATKATELSGFMLRPSMEDALVVAVSQSGTTTDTNRTVDLVRERGATVIAIVNRRNSDLVYKADAVLYTSDGRDIEMSVASTKAFYAQITAGFMLSLSLGALLGTLSDAAIREELQTLEQLPLLIGKILEDHGPIRQSAEALATRQRYWAVVGNGANKVAADEIRIKLSELCYKAIACDYTEDKKHIDLSSEPLIIVCAAGLSSSNLQDAVKETAIFKAHKARPLVITFAGETRFDPYAAGVLTVPRGAGKLSFVLTTVVGHLWGYYAARALDQQAQHLRKLRAASLSLYSRLKTLPGGTAFDSLAAAMRSELGNEIRQVESWLMTGVLDSGLTAASAVRLSAMLHAVTGRMPYDDVVLELGAGAARPPLFEQYMTSLTGAVNDLTRPIDAIKHQAKTVTVGISRLATPTGVLFDALEAAGVSFESLLPTHLETLQAISPLVDAVTGSVHYALLHLNEAGEPTLDTRIQTLQKTGLAAGLRSRADHGAPLIGSKWLIAMEKRLFVGVGSSDGRHLVMFPLLSDGRLTGLMLLHVRFQADARVAERLSAVRHYRNRYEKLIAYVTELNMAWNDQLLAYVPVEQLFEGSSESVARAVQHGVVLAAQAAQHQA